VFAAVIGRLAERHRVFALIPGPARGYLKRQLLERGVAFRHDGFVPFRAMPSYYHACDLYLMTGRQEGGPAAVLESLACGVPFVGHRAGMAPDVIRDGENGYLADVDDVDELVRKADRLLCDQGARHAFASAGLNVARAYAWSQIAPMYEQLYRSVRPS
jgi:glycosyltransferase involved in cell wall biosynthesis